MFFAQSKMKKIIFFIAAFVFLTSRIILSQINVEVGGGYLVSLTNGPIFKHINNGWEISVSGLYSLKENIDLDGTVSYQSRIFNPNSFSFIVPAVLGYPISTVESGENLKSFGISIGCRLKSNYTKFLTTYFSVDLGLVYFQESFYNLRSLSELGIRTITISPQKYSDAKTLFETSAGFGFVFTLSQLFDVILEGKAAYIPDGNEVYFPISARLKINF